MRRPHLSRLPRPSGRRLSAALALLGVLAGLAILLVPLDADLADEPLLRLSPFSPALARSGPSVDCGSPVGSLGRQSDGLGLDGLARDHACQAAASRRVATAVAATAVIGVLGLIGLAGPGNRRLVTA